MRTAITLMGLSICVVCQAQWQSQLPSPDRFGNTYSLPSLPSQATPTTYQPTPMYGLSLINDTNKNVYTEKQELPGGITLINQSGKENRLTVCQLTLTGQTVCN